LWKPEHVALPLVLLGIMRLASTQNTNSELQTKQISSGLLSKNNVGRSPLVRSPVSGLKCFDQNLLQFVLNHPYYYTLCFQLIFFS